MKSFTVIVAGVIALGIVGCEQPAFQTQKVLQKVDNGDLDDLNKKYGRPACEVQAADYALDTNIVAFEVTSDSNLKMGFNFLTSFLELFKINAHLKTGRMSLNMGLVDPIKPEHELINVVGSSSMSGREFSFQLGIYDIGVDFQHYSQTPLAKLTNKALDSAMDQVADKLNSTQEEWSTQVVAVPNSYELVVPVGKFMGLKVGDAFKVFNTEHIWTGEPCKSEHLIKRKTSLEPLAIAVATQVENSAAVLRVLDQPSENILAGATVEVHRLTDENRSLARTIMITEVTGGLMRFEGDQEVDLTPYLETQINAVANDSGFVIYRQKK